MLVPPVAICRQAARICVMAAGRSMKKRLRTRERNASLGQLPIYPERASKQNMRVVVTCGPSYEPIDEVRRITNFSTGELGSLLANHLAKAGCEVVCFRGV